MEALIIILTIFAGLFIIILIRYEGKRVKMTKVINQLEEDIKKAQWISENPALFKIREMVCIKTDPNGWNGSSSISTFGRIQEIKVIRDYGTICRKYAVTLPSGYVHEVNESDVYKPLIAINTDSLPNDVDVDKQTEAFKQYLLCTGKELYPDVDYEWIYERN